MNKIVIPVLIVIVALIVGFFWLNGFIYNEKQGESVDVALATHFGEHLTAPGVLGDVMPIEGYDADLLMSAHSGFVPNDFHAVETLEGHYEVVDNVITFVRDMPEPVSSAERTISMDGYSTLLKNVSVRLGMPIANEADLDKILEIISPEAKVMSLEKMIGKWVGVDDPNFYRTFYENGGYLDSYKGYEESDVNGPWVSFTKENTPDDFPFETKDGAVYLQLDSGEDALYFEVITLTEDSLEMIFLNRGGVLRFSRVVEEVVEQ